MTNKNFGDKYLSGDAKKQSHYKPMLSSSVDLDRMAVESSKAKLISELIRSQDDTISHEFDTYLYGNGLNKKLGVSHYPSNIHLREKQHNTKHPAYQTPNKGLRWNPYVEINSKEGNIRDDDTRSKWRHKNCAVDKYPSKMPSWTTFKPNYQFKDNIMRFCDQITMTRRLNDACCDAHSSTSLSTSTISLEGVGIGNKLCRSRKCPISILKSREYGQQSDIECSHSHPAYLDEAARDTDLDEKYHKPMKSSSINSFRSCKKEESNCEQCYSKRKILYNEGISDVTVNQLYPMTPFWAHRSEDRVANIPDSHYLENMIPRAHDGGSKYHQLCKRSIDKQVRYDDSESEFVRHAVANPKIMTTFKTGFKPAQGSPLSICLPKKVLTSERNIESYIERCLMTTTPDYLKKKIRK